MKSRGFPGGKRSPPGDSGGVPPGNPLDMDISAARNKRIRDSDFGLLGGMLGWPGSDWTEEAPDFMPPFQAKWVEAPGEVRHTFTHFHLRLRVMVALVPPDRSNRHFIDKSDFRPLDLPTVMRKVWSVAYGLK